MESNERAPLITFAEKKIGKKLDEKHLISPLSPLNFDSSPETSKPGENHQIERTSDLQIDISGPCSSSDNESSLLYHSAACW